MRRLAALALLLATLAPAPRAEAQTVVSVCVANQSGAVLRSRLRYMDWQGQLHTSGWNTTALGQRACHRLQDIHALTIEVQANDLVWREVCREEFQGGAARRSRTVFVTGTLFNLRCAVEG